MVKEDLKEVAQRVKEMRELSAISIHEMAEATGMSIEDYMALEEGKIDFTFSFIYKAAEKFKVDIADILHLPDNCYKHIRKRLAFGVPSSTGCDA